MPQQEPHHPSKYMAIPTFCFSVGPNESLVYVVPNEECMMNDY